MPANPPPPLPRPMKPPSRGPNPFALILILTIASSGFLILSSRRQADPTSRLPKEKAHSQGDGGMIFPNLREGEGDRKLAREMEEMEKRRGVFAKSKVGEVRNEREMESGFGMRVGGLEGKAQDPALGPGGGREIVKGEKVWLGPTEGKVDFRELKREEESRRLV